MRDAIEQNLELGLSKPIAWADDDFEWLHQSASGGTTAVILSANKEGKFKFPLYTTPFADTEDARRYRWLRQRQVLIWEKVGLRQATFEASSMCNLDSNIDAAMKEDSHE